MHYLPYEYTVVASDGKTEIKSSESQNPQISSLVFDSRDVKPGALFFALPGTHTTENIFIPKAIENGAAAIIFQVELEGKIFYGFLRLAAFFILKSNNFLFPIFFAEFYY